MEKIRKGYRFSPRTLELVEEVMVATGLSTETAVMEMAVAELHRRFVQPLVVSSEGEIKAIGMVE